MLKIKNVDIYINSKLIQNTVLILILYFLLFFALFGQNCPLLSSGELAGMPQLPWLPSPATESLTEWH